MGSTNASKIKTQALARWLNGGRCASSIGERADGLSSIGPAPTEGGAAIGEQPTSDILLERSWPIELGGRWRLIDEDIQWVLQRRKGRPRRKNPGWESIYYLRGKAGLLLHLDRLGLTSFCPLSVLDHLPEWHP
jgi:hypothetical protein